MSMSWILRSMPSGSGSWKYVSLQVFCVNGEKHYVEVE
jgi:hypothetical protein